MHPLKAPGSNGFSTCFFSKTLEDCGSYGQRVVLNFLNSTVLDPEVNATFIALIPKTLPVTKVTDFCLISLCNVLYKFIAKVLANRLKKVLSSVISHQQSVFVPRRLIMDNVLVAYEALHIMDTRMKGRKGFMALKLEMSKAYDCVE